MDDLVIGGAVIKIEILEGGARRQADPVGGRHITGPATPMFQHGQGQDPFRHIIVFLINDLAGGKGGKIEPFALLHIEDRVSPGKGDDLLLPVFIRLRVKIRWIALRPQGQKFPEDDMHAFLTLPDTAAELFSVSEGEPAGIDKALQHGHQVEQYGVQSPVGPVGERVTENAVPDSIPGPGPGNDAVIQGGDDLVGDFCIDVRFFAFLVHDPVSSVCCGGRMTPSGPIPPLRVS